MEKKRSNSEDSTIKSLKYRIGEIDVSPSGLKFKGRETYDASHKFVVEALEGQVVIIYVSQERRHKDVVRRFRVEGKKVGGGSCYLNGEDRLVLDDFSGDYEAIPREVAEKFAVLLKPKIEKLGVDVKGIAVNPNKFVLNQYWIDLGFGDR